MRNFLFDVRGQVNALFVVIKYGGGGKRDKEGG